MTRLFESDLIFGQIKSKKSNHLKIAWSGHENTSKNINNKF